MKKGIKALLLGTLLVGNIAQANNTLSEEDIRYLPELRSAAWSPDLTKEEIRLLRHSVRRTSTHAASEHFIRLEQYAQDKRNVAVRYYYSIALAKRGRIEESLQLLKALSLEGYPYAIRTYWQERVCQLTPYQETCKQYGFKEVYKRAYLNWARKDPLIPNMYHYAVGGVFYNGRIPREPLKYTPEALAIWQEGAKAGSFKSAQRLYYYYLAVVEQGAFSKRQEEQLYQQIEFYKARAKELMFGGLHWGGGLPPSNCYQDYQKKIDSIYPVDENSICLTKEEEQRLLIEFAKKGKLFAFDNLTMMVHPRQRTSKYAFDKYIYAGEAYRNTFPHEMKLLYDKAIAANNGRGWAEHGYSEGIGRWENLFQDEGMKSLYKQAGN